MPILIKMVYTMSRDTCHDLPNPNSKEVGFMFVCIVCGKQFVVRRRKNGTHYWEQETEFWTEYFK